MDKGIKTRNKQMKQILRSLSNDADEGSKNIPKKGLCGLLKFIASSTTRSISQMWAIVPKLNS